MSNKNDICFQILIKGEEMHLYEAGVKWYEAEDRQKWRKKSDSPKATLLPTNKSQLLRRDSHVFSLLSFLCTLAQLWCKREMRA